MTKEKKAMLCNNLCPFCRWILILNTIDYIIIDHLLFPRCIAKHKHYLSMVVFLWLFNALLLGPEINPAQLTASARQRSMKSKPAKNPVNHADSFSACESDNSLPCFCYCMFFLFFFVFLALSPSNWAPCMLLSLHIWVLLAMWKHHSEQLMVIWAHAEFHSA